MDKGKLEVSQATSPRAATRPDAVASDLDAGPALGARASARYVIRKKIADGGMAEIFLASQSGAEGFARPVILKRILPGLSADPQFRDMLVDEAHIAMSLNHGNIVPVLDLGRSAGATSW